MNYKIFLINLDGASKRFDEIRRQLDFMGVHFERVSAVDGNLLSQDKIDCCYSKELNRQKYFVPLTRGEIGCYLSHISIFKKLLDENLDYAIVLEDDLVFKPGFARIPSVVESIKVKWDYIKLIAPGKKKQINSRIGLGIDSGNGSDFELVTWRKVPIGTAAYVVSRDGAKKFIGSLPEKIECIPPTGSQTDIAFHVSPWYPPRAVANFVLFFAPFACQY